MAQLLDLPLEVRNMIYQHVARGAKVRFAPVARYPLSTCGALLVCCKQISAEFLPTFLELARIDFTTTIYKKTGVTMLLRFPVSAIQHAKLRPIVFADDGGMIQLRAMSRLQSFTYKVDDCYRVPETVMETSIDCHSDCPDSEAFVDDCTYCDQKYALLELKDTVNERKSILVGMDYPREAEDAYDVNERHRKRNAIRKIIGAWEFAGKPFKLIAQVDIKDPGNLVDCYLVGSFVLPMAYS
jgi:hypothetical protein